MNCPLYTARYCCLLPLLLLLLLLLPTAAAAQCDPKEFARIFGEARVLQDSGRYIEAKNTYEAAKIYACNNRQKLRVDNTVDSLFDLIVRSRLQTIRERNRADSIAEANRRQVLSGYADNLAYKSAIALERGDPATAFRLAELAQRYVEPDNPNVTRTLVDNVYYAEDPANPRLAWMKFALEGHTRSVMSAAFAPDGKTLATASEDGTIRLWDLQKGLETRRFRVKGLATKVAISPDGRLVASVSEESQKIREQPGLVGVVRVWDLESGNLAYTLQETGNFWLCAAFSPDSAYLATGSSSGQVTIWEAKTGARVKNLTGHSGKVRTLAFSSDSKRLVTGSGDRTVRVWDVADGKTINTLETSSMSINAVAFSPDGARVAVGSTDITVKIWDWAGSNELKILTGHRAMVASLAYSPDGKWLVSGSMDNTAKIWNAETGSEIFAPLVHSDQIRSVAFAPDGRYLATAGGRNFGASDKTVRVWDLEARDYALWLYDTSGTEITSLAFSPDGRSLAAGTGNNEVVVREVAGGRRLLAAPAYFPEITEKIQREITSLAFSDDGAVLAAGTAHGIVSIRDSETGKFLSSLSGQEGLIRHIAFSPGRQYLVTAATRGYDWDGFSVKVWDGASGQAVRSLGEPDREVSCMALTPDGRLLGTGAGDSITFGDLLTGKKDRTLTGHKAVECLAFSPDGTLCATGAPDNLIKIRDWRSGKNILTLKGHNSDISTVVFWGGNDRLLSVSKSRDAFNTLTGEKDNSIKVWDLHSGKILLSLPGYNWNTHRLAISPEGQRLAVTSDESSIKILELAPGPLIASVLKTRAVAFLTPAQLDAYDLENLLDLRPENEALLIATGDQVQIKAFADLAAAQATGSNVLASVEPHFARAERLYAAALNLHDEPTVRQDYAAMLRQWAEVCTAEGLVSRAAELIEKAGELWKD